MAVSPALLPGPRGVFPLGTSVITRLEDAVTGAAFPLGLAFAIHRGGAHEAVVKVRQGDTTVIPPEYDHAQVAAPGYGMYYLWMIRHLPGNPYTGFTFTADHTWTLDPAQQGWRPADSPLGPP